MSLNVLIKKTMKILHARIKTGSNFSKSLFYIDGRLECFILEDGFNEVKVHGETRIPEGIREITLRDEGGMHSNYLSKFGSEFHKGMLWIRDVEGFEYIYIHYGNYPKDTLGCLLTGDQSDIDSPMVGSSVNAYKKIYPKIASAILSGEKVTIETINLNDVLCPYLS